MVKVDSCGGELLDSFVYYGAWHSYSSLELAPTGPPCWSRPRTVGIGTLPGRGNKSLAMVLDFAEVIVLVSLDKARQMICQESVVHGGASAH